jgi:hypothetical protein
MMMGAVAVIAIVINVWIPRPLDRADAIRVAASFVAQRYRVADFPTHVRQGRYIADTYVTGYDPYWVVEFIKAGEGTIDYLVQVDMNGRARVFQYPPDDMSR